jgi:hypothetical protein
VLKAPYQLEFIWKPSLTGLAKELIYSGVVCGEVRRRRLCAALFPDLENEQNGYELGHAALPEFIKETGSNLLKKLGQ